MDVHIWQWQPQNYYQSKKQFEVLANSYYYCFKGVTLSSEFKEQCDLLHLAMNCRSHSTISTEQSGSCTLMLQRKRQGEEFGSL